MQLMIAVSLKGAFRGFIFLNRNYRKKIFVILKDTKFCAKLFDKKDSFRLPVVIMPYLVSNIPPKVYYSTIGAEILRLSKKPMMLASFDQSNDETKF